VSEKPSDLTRRDLLRGAAAVPLAGALAASEARAEAPATKTAAAPAPAVRKTPSPHVVVVGAGAFGGWTALHLLRNGARVTLVDAWGPGNARASSGGETRVIRGTYGPDQIYVDWVVRSFAQWRELEKTAGQQLYHPTGVLWMFREDDAYARSSAPLVRQAGMKLEPIELAEAARRFPQVRFAGVRHAWWEDEAGFLLARRGCAAVLAQCRAQGAQYRELAVRPVTPDGDRVGAVTLSDGSTLQGDAFVFAGGPWMGKLLPGTVGARVRPSRQELHYFGTPAGDSRWDEAKMPVWIDFADHIFYGIPGNEWRGFKVADDTRGESFDPESGERRPTDASLLRARVLLAERFPDLARAPLLLAEVCQDENSPDGHYLLGPVPGVRNAWMAGGGSGHGYKLGPAVGEHMAQLVLGEAEPIAKFRPDRAFPPDANESQLKAGEHPG